MKLKKINQQVVTETVFLSVYLFVFTAL